MLFFYQMKTSINDLSFLSSSVIAVPPLCRNNDYSINVEENRKLIKYLEIGGVRTLLYGGNANLYNIAISEYSELLEMLQSECGDQTLVIPSVGPFFGNITDQATILKGSSFPTVMILPTLFPAKPEGVARAVRCFVERSGIKAVLYIKDESYIPPQIVSELVHDGIISWIKYAIVREETSKDDYLKELLNLVDPKMVVSGIGEQPAIIHLRDFGISGFTSGCVCIAPSKSMQMLAAIKANDFESAESIRASFETLENLRNAHGPIPVLHHAVALADIAQTGAHLPLMSDLDEELIDPIKEASLELFEFNLD